ncbi:MAG: periplasmic heavy metal sensor [candidate division Zixibacteria bacterium]|nr:periplasmic heavy metal sensor [candidate division Zixibacteria bacterium]
MKTIKIIAFVLTLGFVAPLSAQPFNDFPPPGGGPHGGPRGDGQMREKMKERIETIKIWRLTESLDLSSEQSEKFFPLYKKFHDDREPIDKERREVFGQLDKLTKEENPDENKINGLLDQLDNFDQRMQDRKIKFRQDLKGILTTQQIGRLYVFEVEFMRHIQEIMRDVRRESREKGFKGNRK